MDKKLITIENEVVELCGQLGRYDTEDHTPPLFVDDLVGDQSEMFWDWVQGLLRASARNAIGIWQERMQTSIPLPTIKPGDTRQLLHNTIDVMTDLQIIILAKSLGLEVISHD